MRELLLLRHAKSSWDDPGLDDHDRPLAGRGRRAAPAIGRWLRRNGPEPDLVVCSTAERTRQTYDRFCEGLGSRPEVSYEQEIYLADPEDLLARVRGVDASVSRLMMIGHNPGTHELAVGLTGSTDGKKARKALKRMKAKFPTGALAHIVFDVEDWSQVAPGEGTLRVFVRPKDLSRAEELRL